MESFTKETIDITVNKEDTLSSIALKYKMRYYLKLKNSEDLIKEINNIEEIKPGQVFTDLRVDIKSI